MPQTTNGTLYEKLWSTHVVSPLGPDDALLYVDRHLVQEVSSPQAFETLQNRGLPVRRPDLTLAVADHAIPTDSRGGAIADPLAAAQVARLEANTARFGVPYLPLTSARQGIVHVVGPELGFTLPGATLVCGDSHTSTHGAFGALAFGIGASECMLVLATQCLPQRRARTMRVRFVGPPAPGVTAKDLALALIAQIGTSGAAGHAIEYQGEAVRSLSMEGRMTLCNMAIETGARVGLVAPDETTFAYLEGREYAPAGDEWHRALAHWHTLRSDPDARFDREVTVDVAPIRPMITWGTTPEQSVTIEGRVPDPRAETDPEKRERIAHALDYMGLVPGTSLSDIAIDRVFIGSCTNGRIEDLREAARVVAGRRVADGVAAMVVPGSSAVRLAAEAEGLDTVFRKAGFEWRHAGCSMCVAMNNDRLAPGKRCASTSNRNFEGRQGRGGRTHLMSPATAAAAAISGRLAPDSRGCDGVPAQVLP
ncbi:3-isopropylmalate dehydratase large subunit [Novosphingobium resinovorum]|uniref:3-isopropylmalate dehydratase large subunit n=1 Tax=Novosphingobium resinovorum TaxID=158500 RepID=UPI002ED63CBF|nr:3-isopropylmalate dehydratase large subunit [Novosphingobium resinovorum]